MRINAALLSGFFLATASLPVELHQERTSFISDSLFWAEKEGNLGLEIIGKFQSEEKLLEVLNLNREIGKFKSKRMPRVERMWILRDILVSIDLNSTGATARWRVSGPKPLITTYVRELERAYEDRSLFYDFGYQVINFHPSTD